MNTKKIFFLLLIASFIIQINSEDLKTETCDGSTNECSRESYINEKGEEVFINNKRKMLYSNNFLHQPYSISSNNTDEASLNFDFRTNRKMQSFLSKYGIVTYPRERFIGKQQGNFLHFVHLAYSKHLPLYFDADQIIYPYIEKERIISSFKRFFY